MRNEKCVHIYEGLLRHTEWEGGGKGRPEYDGKQTNKQKDFEGGWLPWPTVCH